MLFYIMSPYSGSRFEMFHRQLVTSHYVSKLFEENIPVVSPVMHWHFAAATHHLPTAAEHWRIQNWNLARVCDAGILFKQPGWEESKGIAEELDWFYGMKKAVLELNLEEEAEHGYDGHCIKDFLTDLREAFPLLEKPESMQPRKS